MTNRSLRMAGFVLLLVCCVAATADDAPPISLPQYISELQHFRQTVDSAPNAAATTALAAKLPPAWRVSAAGREFTVPTDTVASPLYQYATEHTPANLKSFDASIDLLLSDARAMSATKIDFAPERARLTAILSRHEFRKVYGESWYDRLKAAVQRWLLHLLGRIFDSSAFPVVSRIIIWALLAAAVGIVALWIIRSYRQAAIYTSFTGSPDAVSAKPWRDWQAEAQAAAQEGRWRDAVHLSYWAAISFLEAQGLWRPDRARTPREYLRLLASGDLHRDPLQQLTRTFEKVWYGTDPATGETFAGASALLERLGCR